GWIGIPQTVGVVLAVILVTDVVPGAGGYAALAVLLVVGVLPFVFGTPDGQLPRTHRAPFEWRGWLRAFWPDPAAHPDFGWAWLTRFLMVLGNSMAVLYLLYFLRDRVGYSRRFPG